MAARAKSLPDRPVPPKARVSTNDKAFVALAAEDRSSSFGSVSPGEHVERLNLTPFPAIFVVRTCAPTDLSLAPAQ